MDFIPNDNINEGAVKIRIDAVGGDLDRVACRYPLSFMNEMAGQLTEAIENATGIEGLADSSVELIMMFASGTFMEHISGNVTYRRLMLVDKVSAPRDFWVKWTRLDNVDGEYNSENILFELGEDVDQKIREREYRYLLHSGKEKYHNSMGRKKVTEWREVIKRAVRRGELSKIESDFELAPETLELEERIADLLGKRFSARNETKKEEVPYITPENDEFARAMEKARLVVEEASAPVEEDDVQIDEIEIVEEIAETSDAVKETVEEIEEELEFDSEDESDDEIEIEVEIVESVEEEIPEIQTEESIFDIAENEQTEEIDIFEDLELDKSEEMIEDWKPEAISLDTLESEGNEFVIDDEPADEEVVEEDEIEESLVIEEAAEDIPEMEISAEESCENEDVSEEIEEIASEPVFDEEAEEVAEDVEEVELKEEITEQVTEEIPATPAAANDYTDSIADRVADIRAELEMKIRLEYEVRARMKAESELVELRRELQKVKSDTQQVVADLVKENERLRVEYEHLLEQTERDFMVREAEAARRRVEEEQLREQIEMQLRAEAAERERLAEAARMAIEEQHRLEAENARIARQREEEERMEADRIRRIEEEKAIEEVRQAELERIRREDEAQKERARKAMPEMGNGRYSYTSKTVKLLFRRSVDPNITTRIQEIIKATVDYYGKDNVYLKIRASVPDAQTVVLEFTNIPLEEMELLGNIIKILGNSGIGIAKAIIE